MFKFLVFKVSLISYLYSVLGPPFKFHSRTTLHFHQNMSISHNLITPEMQRFKRPINASPENNTFKKSMQNSNQSAVNEPEFTISLDKPPQCKYSFVTRFPCPSDPLTYKTFLTRRKATDQGDKIDPSDPIPPLGSKSPVVSIDIKAFTRRFPIPPNLSDSPSEVREAIPVLSSHRKRFIGAVPLTQWKSLQSLQDSLPGVRNILLILNFSGFEWKTEGVKITSGFCSYEEFMQGQFWRSWEPFVQINSFSSRWQVDLFMSETSFSVHVEVGPYQWLLVAPFRVCSLIQNWSFTNSGKPALIRMHSDLSAAFAELSLALSEDHSLVFLSPPEYDENSPTPVQRISSGSYFHPNLPDYLPSGPSEAFFSPVSMLVASSSLDEDGSSSEHTFTVLYTDFGNSPIKIQRCVGRDSLINFQPTGHRLVIPFHEDGAQYKNTLAFYLMQELPFSCWPVPTRTTAEILEAMEPFPHSPQPRGSRCPSPDGGSM